VIYGIQSAPDTRVATAPALRMAAMLAPSLLVVLLLFGGGLALGLIQSLSRLPAADWTGLTGLTGAHFVHVLTDPDFFQSLALTLYVSAASTGMACGISILAALVLWKLAGKNRWVTFVFQIPLVVPHLVIAVAVMFLLAPTGLVSRVISAAGLIRAGSSFPLMVNDAWAIGIIITYVWKEVPFITLMMLPVLQQLGRELLEVGQTLKASRWQQFRFILLPFFTPSLAAAAMIVFAYTFGAFEVPFLLGRTWPVTLPVWAYRNYSDIDLAARPEGIACGILIAVIVAALVSGACLLFVFTRRREG
jgi:putative spermidine/putrescine transport system permease protein